MGRISKTKKFTNWVGREHFKVQLEQLCNKVKQESNKLNNLDNGSYVNGVVKSIKGLPCNPIFNDLGKAYIELNDYTRYLVTKENIDIDLIRTVTAPIMSNNNPTEIQLVNTNLHNVVIVV